MPWQASLTLVFPFRRDSLLRGQTATFDADVPRGASSSPTVGWYFPRRTHGSGLET